MDEASPTFLENLQPQLDKIIAGLTEGIETYPLERTFVMLVGFSKSGKETLATTHSRLATFLRIDSDTIQDRLNETFKFLHDDYSIDGPAYDLRRQLTHFVRRKILDTVLAFGTAVVLDSTNLRRSARTKYLETAKDYGYNAVIVWVRCSEKTLLTRLRNSDEEVAAKGGNPSWVALYKRIQKPAFDPPDPTEADKLIIYESEIEHPDDLFF